MPELSRPYVPENSFGNMMDSAGKSPSAGKVKALKLPDVSKWRDKPFVGDPKEADHWRLDPTTGKPVSLKGPGFLGSLKVPGTGKTATEYSVGVNINGKQIDVPSLVPTLTTEEVKQTLEAAANGALPPDTVIQKATDFAIQRINAGKSPFAGPEETPQ